MRFKSALGLSALCALIVTGSIGCGEGTDVKVANAPAVSPAPPTELKGEAKKAVGPGSSGSMKKNPAASN